MSIRKIGILGSGAVGQALGLGFLQASYEVKLGTRKTSKLLDWQKKAGKKATLGSFEDAAKFGDIVVIATKWIGTENTLTLAGKSNFDNKIVIDVTNPLTFEKEGETPKLALAYPNSGGLTIQHLLPKAKVVKAFNIVTAAYMTKAKLQEGIPDLFIAGNDAEAKKMVSQIASQWGWTVNDLGNIEQSYLLEALAMIWIMYGFRNNHWTHAFKLLKK